MLEASSDFERFPVADFLMTIQGSKKDEVDQFLSTTVSALLHRTQPDRESQRSSLPAAIPDRMLEAKTTSASSRILPMTDTGNILEFRF